MNRTNYPSVFRQHPARHVPTAHECKGFVPQRTERDWSGLTIVIVCAIGFAIIVWQPWRWL